MLSPVLHIIESLFVALQLLQFALARALLLLQKPRWWPAIERAAPKTTIHAGNKSQTRRAAPLVTLAVVVAEAEYSSIGIDELALLVQWCCEVQLEHVFMYDPQGHIKSKHALLVQHLRASAAVGALCRSVNITCGWQKLQSHIAPAPLLNDTKTQAPQTHAMMPNKAAGADVDVAMHQHSAQEQGALAMLDSSESGSSGSAASEQTSPAASMDADGIRTRGTSGASSAASEQMSPAANMGAAGISSNGTSSAVSEQVSEQLLATTIRCTHILNAEPGMSGKPSLPAGNVDTDGISSNGTSSSGAAPHANGGAVDSIAFSADPGGPAAVHSIDQDLVAVADLAGWSVQSSATGNVETRPGQEEAAQQLLNPNSGSLRPCSAAGCCRANLGGADAVINIQQQQKWQEARHSATMQQSHPQDTSATDTCNSSPGPAGQGMWVGGSGGSGSAGVVASGSCQPLQLHLLDAADSFVPLLAAARGMAAVGASPSHRVPEAAAVGVSTQGDVRLDSDSCSSRLRAPGRSYKEAGALLYGQMAAAAGPEVAVEPSVVLVYGPVLTLAGYPPFHTRGCEIYHMGRLAAATRQRFTSALARFYKTEQRNGR